MNTLCGPSHDSIFWNSMESSGWRRASRQFVFIKLWRHSAQLSQYCVYTFMLPVDTKADERQASQNYSRYSTHMKLKKRETKESRWTQNGSLKMDSLKPLTQALQTHIQPATQEDGQATQSAHKHNWPLSMELQLYAPNRCPTKRADARPAFKSNLRAIGHLRAGRRTITCP